MRSGPRWTTQHRLFGRFQRFVKRRRAPWWASFPWLWSLGDGIPQWFLLRLLKTLNDDPFRPTFQHKQSHHSGASTTISGIRPQEAWLVSNVTETSLAQSQAAETIFFMIWCTEFTLVRTEYHTKVSGYQYIVLYSVCISSKTSIVDFRPLTSWLCRDDIRTKEHDAKVVFAAVTSTTSAPVH